jgi:hypothetical protein
MTFQQDYMHEIRQNIADAEQREQERLAAIVEKANAGANRAAAEREAAERQAEQERERAIAEREQAKVDAAREDYRRALRAVWTGSQAEFDEAFPGLWRRYQKEAARRALEDQRLAAQRHYSQTF